MTDTSLMTTEARDIILQNQKYGDDALTAVTSSGSYLPRIQYMTAASKKVKSEEFPANSFALIDGQAYIDLGKEVDTFVVAWRPKAMDVGSESPIAVYDHTDPMFIDIQGRSDQQNSGCMFGPEFLLWIPSKQRFATLFCGSKSSRNEAKKIRTYVGGSATFCGQLIETKKYSWRSVAVKSCQTPFQMPEPEALMEELERFNNPPKTEVEVVEETPTRER